jgi:predicted nucleic acid-binding protein
MSADRFLVDTSITILALRKDFIPEINDRPDRLLESDPVVTAVIINQEILAATRAEKEFKLLIRIAFNLDAPRGVGVGGTCAP